MDLKGITQKIDLLEKELDELRPLKPEDEQRVMQKFRLDWNYNSNNIEGNSLTYGETKALLLFGITAQGKPLKDHLEIEGHNEAIDYIVDVAGNKEPLTEAMIRNLHKMILHDEYEIEAITPDGQPTKKLVKLGKYKSLPNHVKTITGEIFRFATPEETPAKMEDLMKWYRENFTNKDLHPLIFAVEFHYRFIRIHPFDDGNGRVVRLLMNLILMQKGLPPIIIRVKNKEEYYHTLQQADSGNFLPFYVFMGEQLLNSLNIILSAAKGEEIEEPDDIDKEILLLKSKIENLGNSEINEPKNENNVLAVFELSIIPLLSSVFEKIGNFNDYFKEIEIRCLFNSSIVNFQENNALEKIIEYLRMNNPADIQNFGIYYNLNAFKKDGVNDFNVNLYLHFIFEKYKYRLIYDNKNYDKLFGHYFNETEIKKLTSLVLKRPIKDINKFIAHM